MPVSGLPPCDETNVFARILRGELPCQRLYEDEWALAFPDIAPRAPVHVLVIPQAPFVSLADFSAHATPAQIAGFFAAVGAVARQLGLEAPGYRRPREMIIRKGFHPSDRIRLTGPPCPSLARWMDAKLIEPRKPPCPRRPHQL